MQYKLSYILHQTVCQTKFISHGNYSTPNRLVKRFSHSLFNCINISANLIIVELALTEQLHILTACTEIFLKAVYNKIILLDRRQNR